MFSALWVICPASRSSCSFERLLVLAGVLEQVEHAQVIVRELVQGGAALCDIHEAAAGFQHDAAHQRTTAGHG